MYQSLHGIIGRIPAQIVLVPQPYPPYGTTRHQDVICSRRIVQWVQEILLVTVHIGP